MGSDSRVEALDLSDEATARQALALQRASYRVEADLIGFDGIPPLHETYEEMISQPLRWIGVWDADQLVAALAYALGGEHCDIDRRVVAPSHFGRGLASALLESLFDYSRITVSIATANHPARCLYEKHGFQRVSEREIAPGITATRYERRA